MSRHSLLCVESSKHPLRYPCHHISIPPRGRCRRRRTRSELARRRIRDMSFAAVLPFFYCVETPRGFASFFGHFVTSSGDSGVEVRLEAIAGNLLLWRSVRWDISPRGIVFCVSSPLVLGFILLHRKLCRCRVRVCFECRAALLHRGLGHLGGVGWSILCLRTTADLLPRYRRKGVIIQVCFSKASFLLCRRLRLCQVEYS